MQTMTMTQAEVASSEVRLAYGRTGYGRAGRVVSGLLKAAVKDGRLKSTKTLGGRLCADIVHYSGPAEVFDEIRAEAIRRATT